MRRGSAAVDRQLPDGPSVISFVNERFREIFANPGDPEPIDLQPYRAELDEKGARTVALTASRRIVCPRTARVGARRAAIAETIAAFIERHHAR